MIIQKPTWMTRFWKDFTKKEFIPIKILFFLIYGGMATLFPFLTIQARSLGITVDELGIIYSLLPILGVLTPACAGMFADTLGNFKVFLAIMVSLSGLASLLFLVIPPGRVVHTLPEELPLTLNCSRFSSNLLVKEPLTCAFRNISKIEMRVKKCNYICETKIEPKLTIIGLNETWCSVTENCDMLKNVESISRTVSLLNNASSVGVMSNKFVTFDVEISYQELGTNHYMSHQFCPDVQELMVTNNVNNKSHDNGDDEKSSPNCWLQCDVVTTTKTACSNTQTTQVINPGLTMVAYIIVRLFIGFTTSASIPLFEGAAIAILKEHKGDFGYQRMYANLGMIILTPISGKLIDLLSTATGKEDFRPAFFMYCGIKFLCAIIIFFMNLTFKKPSKTVIKDVKTLLVNPRVTTFLAFTLISGTCAGFIATFLFWLLEDMNADKQLMGLTVTVGAVSGLPLLMLSTYIIKRLGHIGTLCLSMSFYVIRLLGYSFIQNPWMAMPFEAMKSFTNSLKGVASVSYIAVISAPSTIASLQGIYGGIYHGIGRGAGSLIGGYLIKYIGIRATFQIMAAVSGIGSLSYFAAHWFIFKRNDENKSENEEKGDKEDCSKTIDGFTVEEDALENNTNNSVKVN